MPHAVTPIEIENIVPAEIALDKPEVRFVDPRSLLINERYQREINTAGRRLISKIISQFEWARYKVPNVVETSEGLEVVDGQHTVIATASHPDIRLIPVLVAPNKDLSANAKAFVGINKDRLGVTAPQLHHAMVAAGHDSAVAIEMICNDLGIRILRSQRGPKQYKENETVAVNAISACYDKYGPEHTRRLLTILSKSKLAPIKVEHVKAMVEVLADDEFTREVEDEALTQTIMRTRLVIDKEAELLAVEKDVKYFRALASVWKRAARKGPSPSQSSRRLAAAE